MAGKVGCDLQTDLCSNQEGDWWLLPVCAWLDEGWIWFWNHAHKAFQWLRCLGQHLPGNFGHFKHRVLPHSAFSALWWRQCTEQIQGSALEVWICGWVPPERASPILCSEPWKHVFCIEEPLGMLFWFNCEKVICFAWGGTTSRRLRPARRGTRQASTQLIACLAFQPVWSQGRSMKEKWSRTFPWGFA